MPWYTVDCYKRNGISRGNYEELVKDWIWSLERFEYIFEENSIVWVGKSNLQLALWATRNNSLDASHFNKYVLKNYEKVILKSVEPPKAQLKEYRSKKKFPAWQTSKELYFYTNYIHQEMAVREGENGIGIPIYQLPLEPDQSEGIDFWARLYQHFDAIQLGCGELEIPSYRQMADIRSGLSKSGRKLCKMVEDATGKPTYYFLHRYWGWKNKSKELNRRCPSCGGIWARKPTSSSGIRKFAFKCTKCRLISEVCSTSENDKHAEIGIYRVRKVKR